MSSESPKSIVILRPNDFASRLYIIRFMIRTYECMQENIVNPSEEIPTLEGGSHCDVSFSKKRRPPQSHRTIARPYLRATPCSFGEGSLPWPSDQRIMVTSQSGLHYERSKETHLYLCTKWPTANLFRTPIPTLPSYR
jgi:hypothetical protein